MTSFWRALLQSLLITVVVLLVLRVAHRIWPRTFAAL
jgi:hypothetical protein